MGADKGVAYQGQGWNQAAGDYGGDYLPLPILPISDYETLKAQLLEVRSMERALVTIDETENGYIVKHAGKTYVCLTNGLTTLLESLLRK